MKDSAPPSPQEDGSHNDMRGNCPFCGERPRCACDEVEAPASPAPHDTLREADMDGAGAQFGFCIVDRGPEDSHKMVVIYTEDDTLWHKVTRFSHVWLDDLARVISEAQSALAAQPTTTEIPAELGVGSSGGDEVLREAAHALALLPRHLPWSDTCSKCGGITFISPDVLRSIHAEALGVVETTLASCTGGAAKCPGGPWVNGGDDEHGLFADPPGGESQ